MTDTGQTAAPSTPMRRAHGVHETGEILGGISDWQVRQLIRRWMDGDERGLEASRGRGERSRYLVTDEAIDRYLAANRVGATEELELDLDPPPPPPTPRRPRKRAS